MERGIRMEKKVIVSATLESISLMPDGTFEPSYTNVIYGEPDLNGDVLMPGCFDKSINESAGKFRLVNHNPKL